MTEPNPEGNLFDFGMIGLGVMGENLALNIEDHGFSVAVWNREERTVDTFMQKNAGKKLAGTRTLEEFVAAIRRPRRIMMMIKAGSVVSRDQIEASLYSFDEPVTPNAIEVLVSRVRKKLATLGVHDQLVTLRGVGYLMLEPVD